MTQTQATHTLGHPKWRGFIEKFLAHVLDISGGDYAVFIDASIGRERYVFGTRDKSLPDINWHDLVGFLWKSQQARPEYCVLDKEKIGQVDPDTHLSRHFNEGYFNLIICFPLIDDDRFLGLTCIFSNTPGVDADRMRSEIRDKLEATASLTASAIAAMSDVSRNSGNEGVFHEALKRLPEGLLMADSMGIVVEVNNAFSDITGVPIDSLIGRNLKEHPILGTDCDYLVAKLLENGHPFEVIARLGAESPPDDDTLVHQENPVSGKFLRLRGTAYPQETVGPPDGMLLLADDVTSDVLTKREANRRERRHSQEIELASRLQQNFFPAGYQKKRVKIATRLIAARGLAGDFFDIFDLGPNTIGIVMGDVVGKGIPGSLMAMSVHGMIANQAGALTPPMKVLERANEALYMQVKGEYWYATCFYAKLHVTQLRMTFSRAGHELPIWWHKETGEVTYLEGEGLPLGIFSDSRYVTLQVDLDEGDRLLFYTDGLTDATNRAGERFGHERLVELFRKNCSLSSKNLIRLLENEIVAFQDGREQLDDIAIALISVVPDSWTTLTIPPFPFMEILEGLLEELKLRGVDEDTAFKVRLSLDECVTNANRHGHQGDNRRNITVSYLVEPERVTMKVRDQGPGFDFGLIADPTLEENLMHPGGRGVFLTLKLMDEVGFNDVGNEVTMVKYLHTVED